MKGRVHWYYDSLTPGMLAFPFVVDKVLEKKLEDMVGEVQDYMQANAPWEDQSGGAREGLTAEYEGKGLFHHSIVIYHTVDYGIWLEIRWNGRYAIIQPTIEHFGPEVMGRLSMV